MVICIFTFLLKLVLDFLSNRYFAEICEIKTGISLLQLSFSPFMSPEIMSWGNNRVFVSWNILKK